MSKWNICEQLKVISIDILHNMYNNTNIPRCKAFFTQVYVLQGNKD